MCEVKCLLPWGFGNDQEKRSPKETAGASQQGRLLLLLTLIKIMELQSVQARNTPVRLKIGKKNSNWGLPYKKVRVPNERSKATKNLCQPAKHSLAKKGHKLWNSWILQRL